MGPGRPAGELQRALPDARVGLRRQPDGLGGPAAGARGRAARRAGWCGENLPLPSQLAAPVGTLLERVREAVVDRLAKEDTVLFSVIYEFGSDQSRSRSTCRMVDTPCGSSWSRPGSHLRRRGQLLTPGGADDRAHRQASAFAHVPAPPTRSTAKTKAGARRAVTTPRKGSGPR